MGGFVLFMNHAILRISGYICTVKRVQIYSRGDLLFNVPKLIYFFRKSFINSRKLHNCYDDMKHCMYIIYLAAVIKCIMIK